MRVDARALVLLLAACGGSEATGPAPLAAPSGCDALQSLSAATTLLEERAITALAGATTFTPRDAMQGQVPLSAGYALDSVGADGASLRGRTPLLVRSKAEFAANTNLKNLELDLDWSSEALLVTRESPREALYRYAAGGPELVVVTAKATPCLSPADATSFAATEPLVKLYRVPGTVTTVRTAEVEERYRMVAASGLATCLRAGTPAVGGGGAPSVVRGPDGVRLYFNGFSAMTGNVSFATASDASGEFIPNGISSFAERGVYADIYEPFVERTGDGFRMTASAYDYIGKSTTPRSRVVEMTSTDGLAWSKGTPLLPDTTRGSSPARVSTDGEDRLYYARDGAILVARRRGSAPFVEEATPALPAPGDLAGFDGLGYDAPEVARIGSRWVLFATALWGGLSREWAFRGSIGYATSEDGLRFSRAAGPLLVPESEDEASGIGSPAVLVDGETFTVFMAAINRNFEPVVKRASCTLP